MMRKKRKSSKKTQWQSLLKVLIAIATALYWLMNFVQTAAQLWDRFVK